MIRPVLLCGGSGTRLWPLSRTHHPKQFLRLVDNYSLLQNTLLRLNGINGLGEVIAIANENHRFLLAEQLLEVGVQADILLEPVSRNTAPAVAAAAVYASEQAGEGESPLLLVLPSDHVISDGVAFQNAVEKAIPHARSGKLVTFGILPNRPETGYGYIKKGQAVEGGFMVGQFAEKPDGPTAENYIRDGHYLWNSGIFMFRADVYLDMLAQFVPEMKVCAENAVRNGRRDLDFFRLDLSSFSSSPSDSIDYAVMEKSTSTIVIPLDAGWSDIGAWDALAGYGKTDSSGNTVRGDVIAVNSSDSIIFSDDRLVAAIGMSDMVVVSTPDVVLVAHKSSVQNVKQIVESLKEASRVETEFQPVVHRPWGSYENLANGARYQVKRILVKPGASLSLQMHYHRAEHWVVVKGTAKVIRGEKVLLLSENESTYIPLGTVHRLENPGSIDLEIIEVQSGSHLDENDILRLEDNYGRKS